MSCSIVPIRTGTLPFTIHGDTHHTWFKVIGDLSNRTHIPLVVLHGGPGLTHDYLSPLTDLATISSIPVVFYDQLGSGRSTHLPTKPRSFWTFDLFINQLTSLLARLGIADAFDLLGHSWGGALACEFVVRRQPAGLRRLVLSNTLAAARLRSEAVRLLLARLPAGERDALALGPEAGGDVYQRATENYMARHLCKVQPWPEAFAHSYAQAREDTTVTKAMSAGEYDEDWTIIDRLDRIHVPTLVINGRADFVQDFVCKPFFDHIRKVRWVTLQASSHSPFWEERAEYMRLVAGFLKL